MPPSPRPSSPNALCLCLTHLLEMNARLWVSNSSVSLSSDQTPSVFFRLVRYFLFSFLLFLFSAVSVTAGNEAGVLPRFLVVFLFFLCGLYLPTHAHFQLVLSYYAALVFGSQVAKPYVVDFEFCFNNLYNWMCFFPASTKAVFLFNYHTSINPALCFALHAGELLLSVMFVLL